MADYDHRVKLLIEFGKEIERYFLDIFHFQSGISFLFYINDALFQSFCKGIGCDPPSIKSALRYCIFKNQYGTWQNPHVAFSMAALQTAVALELPIDSDFEKSFNNRLINELNLNSYNELYNYFYYNHQENLWGHIYVHFSKLYGLNLIIPKKDPDNSNRRYVKYPLSQSVVDHKGWLKLIAKQEQLLGKNRSLSFKEFKQRFSSRIQIKHKYSEDSSIDLKVYKEFACWTVYQYLCKWKGWIPETRHSDKNTQAGYIKPIRPGLIIRINDTAKEFTVFNGSGKPQFSNNHAFSDFFSKNQPFLLFTFDNAYEDYIEQKSIIQPEGLGILATSSFFYSQKSLLEDFFLGIYDYGPYRFVQVLDKYIPKVAELLGFINRLSNSCGINFLGGMKIAPMKWLRGALPILETEEFHLFIDSNRYHSEDGMFDLNTITLNSGPHYLQIPNRTGISIEVLGKQGIEEKENCGWEIVNHDGVWTPTSDKEQVIIQGVTELKKNPVVSQKIANQVFVAFQNIENTMSPPIFLRIKGIMYEHSGI